MLNQGRLSMISELTADVSTMNPERLRQYEETLTCFLKTLPEYETTIAAAVKAKDYAALSKKLDGLCDLLNVISAKEIAAEGQHKLERLYTTKTEVIEAFVAYFLRYVSVLAADIQQSMVEAAAPTFQKPDKATVLAVDDAEFFLTALKKHLHDAPFDLVCVTSGEAAMRYLSHYTPNLFLLDIEMPEMNGYELAKSIRAAGHQGPIIFLTGKTKRDSVSKAVQSGAVDFVVKPVDEMQLVEKIKKYL